MKDIVIGNILCVCVCKYVNKILDELIERRRKELVLNKIRFLVVIRKFIFVLDYIMLVEVVGIGVIIGLVLCGFIFFCVDIFFIGLLKYG